MRLDKWLWVVRVFRTFNAGAEPFRVESLAHEQEQVTT